MTPSEIHANLRQTRLFQDFTDDELSAFIHLLDHVSVPARGCIVRQDDPGESMYILLTGRAHVVHHRDGRKVELATLEKHDFFGELALVDHGPRSADVEAIEACELLTVNQGALAALAGVYPTAAFKFLVAIGRIMVERLRRSNQRYVDSLLVTGDGSAQ